MNVAKIVCDLCGATDEREYHSGWFTLTFCQTGCVNAPLDICPSCAENPLAPRDGYRLAFRLKDRVATFALDGQQTGWTYPGER